MNEEQNVFIESIIYCPSQIYYYFWDKDEDTFWCAYIRQRRGPLTFELVRANPDDGSFLDSFDDWEKISMSREYDINNQDSFEKEEKEIVEIEAEVMSFLRQRFPNISFPENPKRSSQIIDF